MARARHPLAVVSRMIDEIRETQLGSFGAALAMVFGLSALCLRSLSLALVAMIPTTIPVALTLGGFTPFLRNLRSRRRAD